MLKDIFVAFWVFLPAGAANVVPIFAAKLPILKQFATPIDGGRTYKGRRLLGANKTWRGLIAGIVAATAALWLQQIMVGHIAWLQQWTAQILYAQLPTLIVGTLFALGALGGDAVESFFKRRRGVPPGEAWFPFDQLDYIIGGAVAVLPYIVLSIWQYLWLMGLWMVIHLLSTYAGWLLRLKDKPI